MTSVPHAGAATPVAASTPRAYVVGASKERLPAICERLREDGFDVCGHCDGPREFCPPRLLVPPQLTRAQGLERGAPRARRIEVVFP